MLPAASLPACQSGKSYTGSKLRAALLGHNRAAETVPGLLLKFQVATDWLSEPSNLVSVELGPWLVLSVSTPTGEWTWKCLNLRNPSKADVKQQLFWGGPKKTGHSWVNKKKPTRVLLVT